MNNETGPHNYMKLKSKRKVSTIHYIYVVFESMDEQLYRFSTNQKHKDEFSRERAMGER